MLQHIKPRRQASTEYDSRIMLPPLMFCTIRSGLRLSQAEVSVVFPVSPSTAASISSAARSDAQYPKGRPGFSLRGEQGMPSGSSPCYP